METASPNAKTDRLTTGDISVERIREVAREIKLITNNEWIENLAERKQAELLFHNRDRDPERVRAASDSTDTFERFYGNKKYYAATQDSTRYVHDWIERVAPGSIFLDYACGNGAKAIHAAKAGSTLSLGLDISNISIANAETAAARENVAENTIFFQADAEDTRLPDSSIDAIICSGMLHHLDLSYAFPELRRILKPGGRLLAVEALDYNPLIKLYRKLTPDMRTEWEKAHILSLKDLRFAERFFDLGEVRYWHVVSYAGGKFPMLLSPLIALDRLLTKIPGLRLMSWIFTFELVGRAD